MDWKSEMKRNGRRRTNNLMLLRGLKTVWRNLKLSRLERTSCYIGSLGKYFFAQIVTFSRETFHAMVIIPVHGIRWTKQCDTTLKENQIFWVAQLFLTELCSLRFPLCLIFCQSAKLYKYLKRYCSPL